MKLKALRNSQACKSHKIAAKIVIVDDGSKDGTRDIRKNWTARDVYASSCTKRIKAKAQPVYRSRARPIRSLQRIHPPPKKRSHDCHISTKQLISNSRPSLNRQRKPTHKQRTFTARKMLFVGYRWNIQSWR